MRVFGLSKIIGKVKTENTMLLLEVAQLSE